MNKGEGKELRKRKAIKGDQRVGEGMNEEGLFGKRRMEKETSTRGYCMRGD